MTLNELYKDLNSKDGQLSGVYLITRKSDGRPYVGQSICITDRIEQHIKNIRATSDDSSKGIDAAIQKEGWENFNYEILLALPDMTAEQLWRAECIYIDKYDAYNNGFNKTNGNHKDKIFAGNYENYKRHFIVSAPIMKYVEILLKNIGVKLENRNITLIHAFNDDSIKYLKYRDNKVAVINKHCLSVKNDKGEYTEDSKELGLYIKNEVESMKYNLNDIIIANFPYGPIGADCLNTVVNNMGDNAIFINLEPGNDYFIKDGYKYIDTSFNPQILRNGCFKDASQTTVISKIQKQSNNISQVEARILLHLDEPNKELYDALSEYILKVSLNNPLRFTQLTDTLYDENKFLFNPGAFDIHHGYFAVYDSRKKDYTSSTKYNLFKQDATGHANMPGSLIKGCKSFKKIFYSPEGLKFLKVLFGALPEGWGFVRGIFADLEYTDLKSITDMFNTIGLSSSAQVAIFKAIAAQQLTAEELKVSKLAEVL